MPDGAVVEMPDQLDPQLGQRLRSFVSAQQGGAKPAPAPEPETPGRLALGAAQVAGSAVADIPHGVGHALFDIYRRITGNYDQPEPAALQAIHVEPGQAGRDFGPAVAGAIESGVDKLGGTDALTSAVGTTNEAVDRVARAAPFTTKVVAPLAADVAMLAGARGIPKAVGNAARSAGEAVSGIRTAANGEGFDVGGEPGVESLGLKAPSNPPLQAHQHAGNVVAGHEAGLPVGVALTPDTLATAREAPSAVYNRVAQALPDAPLDQQAATAIQSAGQPEGGRVSKGSPQAQTQIEALRAQLLDPAPKSGNQWVNELRGLRQEGYGNVGSEDVSNQQLGRAQLDMARAIEGHIGRNLPADANVDIDQFTAARQALAKNFTVQGALRGKDIDLQALARIQRADPELLSGGLKAIADFASQNPEITRFSNRFQPDIGDALNGISLTRPATWVKPVTAVAGRLKGSADASAAEQAASAAFPPRPAGQFNPLERPLQLTPPPGRAFEPGQREMQAPLGDLLRGPNAELSPPPGNAYEPGQHSLPFGPEPPLPPNAPTVPPGHGRFTVDPDGYRHPLAEGAQAPEGHVTVEGTGDSLKVVDSGGLSKVETSGLLKRYKALRSIGADGERAEQAPVADAGGSRALGNELTGSEATPLDKADALREQFNAAWKAGNRDKAMELLDAIYRLGPNQRGKIAAARRANIKPVE